MLSGITSILHVSSNTSDHAFAELLAQLKDTERQGPPALANFSEHIVGGDQLLQRSSWRDFSPAWWTEVVPPAARDHSQEVVADLAAHFKANQERERLLVYRCSSVGFCGGHGDRVDGIVSLFLLALITQRSFYIDSPRPLPM